MDKDRIKGSAEQAKGAVKEAAGKVFGDKKLETEGKTEKAAGKVQSARWIEGRSARQVRPAPSKGTSHGIDPDYRCISAALWRWRRNTRVTVEVIGDRTLRSELRVPYRLGALSFAVTAWCTVRKPTKKLIIVSTEESARTSAYPSIVDELSRWPVLA